MLEALDGLGGPQHTLGEEAQEKEGVTWHDKETYNGLSPVNANHQSMEPRPQDFIGSTHTHPC